MEVNLMNLSSENVELNSSDTDNFTVYNKQEDLAKLALRSTFLILIAIFSCIGNLLVCITLYWRPYLLTPSNKLVFSLSTSNFIFSVLVLPFVIISSIAEEWLFGQAWCSLTGFITILVMGASMLTLGAIACDRYYAIVHPMFYPMVITGFRTTVLIISSWVVSGICALPPLVGSWSRFTFTPDTGGGCMPTWNEEPGFTAFWFTLCFFIPYVLMLLCYGCIFQVARTKTRQVHSKSDLRKRSSVMAEYSEDMGSYNNITREEIQTESSSIDSFENEDKQLEMVPEITVTQSDDCLNTEEDSGIHLISENVNNSNIFHDKASIEEESTDNNSETSSEENSPKINFKSAKRNGSIPMIIPLSDSRKSSSSSGESKTSSEDQYFKDAENAGNRRKSSNASIISQTSQVFRRTSLAFSSVKYYRNQIKAVCTIAFILGILLITMGSFTIISLVEVAQTSGEITKIIDERSQLESNQPSLSSTALSVATCLMFLTCVYYPLIYGLWNRTVRKEMRCLFCGHQRHPHHEPLRKQRMLSLTTHIQDLGMSPGLTAAIIGEDPVAFKAAVIQDNIARDNNLRLSSRWSKPDKDRVLAAIEKRRHTLPVLSMFGASDTDADNGAIKKRPRRFSRFAMNFSAISEEETEATKLKFAELKYQRNIEKASAQSFADKTYINTIANGGSYKMVLNEKDKLRYNAMNNNSPSGLRGRRGSEIPSGIFGLKPPEVAFAEPAQPDLLYPEYKAQKSRRSSLFNFKTPFLQLSPATHKKNQPGFSKKRFSLAQIDAPNYLKSPEILNQNEIENDEIMESPNPITKRSNSKRTSVHFKIISNLDRDSLGEIIEEEEEFSEQDEESQPEVTSLKKDNTRKVSFDIKESVKDDEMMRLSDGRIHSSKLIYLETGQPLKVNRWSRDQCMTYISSTISYDVLDSVKIDLTADCS